MSDALARREALQGIARKGSEGDDVAMGVLRTIYAALFALVFVPRALFRDRTARREGIDLGDALERHTAQLERQAEQEAAREASRTAIRETMRDMPPPR